MNDDGYRQNGGLGFCVNEPITMIAVERSSRFSLRDRRQFPLQPSEQARLISIVRSYTKSPVQITISGKMPSHYGFGSATGIRLGTLEAITALSGRAANRNKLVLASGRGGTSGIGVTTYFDGGIVFDVGIKSKQQPALPSSALEGKRGSPLVLKQFAMPRWKIGICIPSNIPPQTEEQEIAFFKSTCPIAGAAASEVLYHVIYGAIASASENDFDGFCASIRSIQACTWKRLERALYSEQLKALERDIYAAGACAVGMSSLGPGLYFLANDVAQTIKTLKRAIPHHTWAMGECHNSGREIRFN